MAILTKTLAEFANGTCVWTISYDTVALVLTNVSCTNNSSEPSRATAVVQSTGREFTTLVPPGGTLNQNIPTSQANKLDLTIDARGRPDGIDYTLQWGPGTV